MEKIKAAWQRLEKYNLEFGKVCCEWRDKFRARGFRKRGDGVVPCLEYLGIPISKGCKKMDVCALQGGGRAVNDHFREGLFCAIAQIAHPRVVAFFAYDWKLFLYDASIVLSEWIKSVPFLSNLESLGRERPI